MELHDLVLVSVDDHVVEPPDLFAGRLSGRAAERAPRVERNERGQDVWMFEGKPLPNVGLNAVAGRVPEEYGVDPVSFDQMRRGCFDIHERVRDMDVNGVLGSLNFPHGDHWNPFWAACSETGTVVCLHIGSSSQTVITAMDAPIDTMITLQPMNIVLCAADLLFSPVLRSFPDLRVALSEGGIGWIPYFLERADYTYRHHRAWTNQDFGDRLPSDVFRDQIVTCFIDDAVGIEIRHHLNLDNVCWECYYPHSDSTWPEAPETAVRYLEGLPPDEVDRITHRNAMRLFSYDPFVHIPPGQATVGALRALAADVDTTPVSHGTGKFQPEGPVTAVTLAERIAAQREG